MSKLKKVLMNPWIITIIAPIITLLLLKIVDLITGTQIILKCIHLVLNFFTFFTTSYEWKLYQLILLFLSAPIIGLLILWLSSNFQKLKNSVIPEWFNYTKDTFDRVTYKWEWHKGRDGKYIVSNLSIHCSKCGCLLINERCPNCKSVYYGYIKSNNEIEALILHKSDLMDDKETHI